MKSYATVEEYFASLEAPDRAQLERVRSLILKTVPSAAESISYGIPAFKYKGKPLMYYAAYKDHYSVFPTSGPPAALAEKLTDFKTGRGTVQFTADNMLPDALIVEMLQLRVTQINS